MTNTAAAALKFSHPLVGHRVEVDYRKGLRKHSYWTVVAVNERDYATLVSDRGEIWHCFTTRLTMTNPGATDSQRTTELGAALQNSPKAARLLAHLAEQGA